MYESPIKIYEQMDNLHTEIIKKQNEDIYRAVLSYGITVDKDELTRALAYDSQQYEKGYVDGKADAMAELVRCKDCKACPSFDDNGIGYCLEHGNYILEDDFCSYGERKDDD